MPTGNEMIDSTLPDWFNGRTNDEVIDYSEDYEPEEELNDNK
jgi:hypothetical protein